ncbi:MAG: caspase family protein [Syntrophaceae bacterium]|nr:caspase family protein [Syntrophaceae bacterium]
MMKRLFCTLVVGIVFSGIAGAAEPPKEPILKIETGMHTAFIRNISVDDANRYLVTGSHDKSVRVWELATGRLLSVLRPPIGEGNEGRIDAVAISPDGQTVACGGWTQFAGPEGGLADDGVSIYLFHRATGKLTRRITGLPNVIFHLSFSPDGLYLAATLGKNNGIRVFRTADGALVGEDRDYGADSYYVVFDRRGRLAAASFDGYIRLYDRPGADGLKLLAKQKAPGGKRSFFLSFSPDNKQPFSLSFSPDGEKLAVGFNDSTAVDVLSASDLSHLYSPDTSGVDNGNLGRVSFSPDGRLYAGGTYYKNGQTLILSWEKEGRGQRRELPGALNTIMHFMPLATGGVAYGSGDPAFGVLDKNGRRVLFQSAQIADYRGNREGFRLSSDGKKVSFGYEYGGNSPATFDLSTLMLSPDGDTSDLYPPDTNSLSVTDWKHATSPKLNGRALALKQYEISRSVAISPSRDAFLLGADWSLRYFDRSSNEKWQAPSPGVTWAVNISRDGRLAVAAFGDGTIRWYRLSDGRELLAFFPHKDRKRWVLWTSSGYYDASPGAEELIGWHLNRGKDTAADFFPASRFRAAYYRPDVLARVLETGDEQEALRLANEESGRRRIEQAVASILPPVVTILSPADGTAVSQTEVTLSVSLRSPSDAPVTAIRTLVDGRPVSTERGLVIKPTGDTRQIRVSIPPRDAEVSVIAENRNAASQPSTIRLYWRGKATQDEFVIKPKLYVLAVGVSAYEEADLQLGFAAKDARDFARALTGQKGGLYREVTARILTDKQATRDDIMDGLDWLQKETTSKDIAMVFLAGHGVNDPAGIYYYLPVNANPEKLKRTGVAFSDIKNTMASLAGKAILFVDTCHSGNVMGARRGAADINAVVNELASAENGAVVFASSTGRQYSLEDKAWGNGAFTKALVEGIGGRADYSGKGKITINMLDLYLSERVKELTGGKQTPTTTKPQTIPDFPIAVKR